MTLVDKIGSAFLRRILKQMKSALQMDFFPDLIDRSKSSEGKVSRVEQHRRHICEALSADSQPNLVIHPMKVLANGMDSRSLLK